MRDNLRKQRLTVKAVEERWRDALEQLLIAITERNHAIESFVELVSRSTDPTSDVKGSRSSALAQRMILKNTTAHSTRGDVAIARSLRASGHFGVESHGNADDKPERSSSRRADRHRRC